MRDEVFDDTLLIITSSYSIRLDGGMALTIGVHIGQQSYCLAGPLLFMNKTYFAYTAYGLNYIIRRMN